MSMEELGEFDVPFGRGAPCNSWRQDSLYAKLLDENCEEYVNVRVKRKKEFANNKVIQPIKDKNGRFVKNEDNRWVDVSNIIVTKTVMQALRDRTPISKPIKDAREKEESSVSSEEEVQLPTFRADVRSMLGNQNIDTSEADDGTRERVDQIFESVDSNLQLMSSQLKQSMEKIEDLLHTNLDLRRENQALRGENVQLRESLRLVTSTAAI
jgi:flagellar hook-associated protein FlgK